MNFEEQLLCAILFQERIDILMDALEQLKLLLIALIVKTLT